MLQAAQADGKQSMKEIANDVSLNFDSLLDNLDTFSMLESKYREIDQMNLRIQSSEKLLEKVKRLLESPYFGKVTLTFAGEETAESFYFGRHNFANSQGENLIFDWRSPIAELYYNNELGSFAL